MNWSMFTVLLRSRGPTFDACPGVDAIAAWLKTKRCPERPDRLDCEHERRAWRFARGVDALHEGCSKASARWQSWPTPGTVGASVNVAAGRACAFASGGTRRPATVEDATTTRRKGIGRGTRG